HAAVRILAAGIVETHSRSRDLTSSEAAWPLVLDTIDLGVLDFLRFRGPVRPTPRLSPLLEDLRPREGMRLVPFVMQLAQYIQTRFEYAKDVPLATSPIDDLLKQGKGVCQDFTHLMIALLRSYEVPARYVSGYIHQPGKESQSHAWCEVWLPDLGWF